MSIRTNTRAYTLTADITYQATPAWKYVIHMVVHKDSDIMSYYVNEYHHNDMTARSRRDAPRTMGLNNQAPGYAERFARNAEARPADFLKWYYTPMPV